jgi:CRP-like cAMP-binding protein
MLAGTGDFFGFANSDQGCGWVHCFDASALTKCSVGLFTRPHLLQLLTKLPASVLLKLIEDMNAQWSKVLLYHIKFLRLSFLERLVLILRELGTKCGRKVKNGIIIDVKLRYSELAEMIGCSVRIISRLLSQMVSRGGIEFTEDRKIILLYQFT